jgi:hypothetical protein
MWRSIQFQALFCLLIATAAAPAAFGTSIVLPCSSVPLTNHDDYVDCPGGTGIPANSTVTAVKLYLLPSFQGATSWVLGLVGFRITFIPDPSLTAWTPSGQVCDIRNDSIGGGILVYSSCGLYTGDPNAPGTAMMSADQAFSALAATGFRIMVQRGDLGGTAESILASALVEFTYIPLAPVPELPASLLFATGLLGIGYLKQKCRSVRRLTNSANQR